MIAKHCIIILIVRCLWNARADANNALFETLNKRSEHGLLHSLLKYLIETCNRGSRKIIIYDKDYNMETFTAITEQSAYEPKISASLFTDEQKWQQIKRYQFDDLQVDAVIIFVRVNNAWNDIKYLFNEWRYNRDCILYIFPMQSEDCESYKDILELIMRFYFSVAYYFCVKEYIHVYTHDPYGDTQPPYWDKIDQDLLWGKNWTFYKRSFNRNTGQLCAGFNFKRTDPSNQAYMVFGINKNDHNFNDLEDKDYLYNDQIEQFLRHQDQETIANLKKLMKRKFLYLTIKKENKGRIIRRAIDEFGVDGLLMHIVFRAASLWNYFYPLVYEPLAILSHNRGPMTPLEKIAKFYGKWTLSSLIVIMIITFVVIWLSTKKPGLATFNVLRLLINVEIVTPMNTWRLKLFFSMVFLYFLIIHATFSGHLAEFLTKIKYRSNIDSLEELKDPSIEKVYIFGYFDNGVDELNFLPKKLKYIRKAIECSNIQNHSNYACIAPMMILEYTRANQTAFNNLYISKNTFGFSFSGYPCRPGFPLREQFDWAFMVLFDTGIISRRIKLLRLFNSKAIAKYVVVNHVKYRPIQIVDVSFVFIFLIIGNCLGFICFLFEITLKNSFNKLKFSSTRKPNFARIEVQHCQ